MILAVDTSLGTAVALVDAHGVVHAEESTANALGHAEVIGDLLTRVIADHEVTHVAIGMGPGPFTGLRIGIAAARAFAQARGIPVIPVPSHFAAALTHGGSGPFAIVTDARRREVAVTRFEGRDADDIPLAASDTVLVPRAEAQAHLADVPHEETSEISAAALGQIAARALAARRVLSGPEPLYLRAPDVTMSPKRPGA